MGKGARNERAAVDVYDRGGYWVYRPETAKFGENDLWGLFDLACVRQAFDPEPNLILTQVKSNRPRGIREWFGTIAPFQAVPGVSVQYLVRHDGQGGHDPTPAAWRLAEPTDDGYEWVVDERNEDCETGELLTQYLRVSDVV